MRQQKDSAVNMDGMSISPRLKHGLCLKSAMESRLHNSTKADWLEALALCNDTSLAASLVMAKDHLIRKLPSG